jgi:hypothetical protein
LRELTRRVAVLIVISVAGIGVLAPAAATRSASALDAHTAGLLAEAQRSTSDLPRALLAGRERSAALTLAQLTQPVVAEQLAAATPLPTPPSITFSAAFAPVPTARPTTPPQARSVPPPATGPVVSGKATYYCCTLGYRGQAVVALPSALGGHYDAPPAARHVTIRADRCASIPVVDQCGCYWGTAAQKVADLSPEAWAAITDRSTSMGVVQVTIHLG